MNRMVSRILYVLLTVAMTGCAVGPDFQRPAAPDTSSYVAGLLPEHTASASVGVGEAQRFMPGHQVETQWWKAFGSPALNALVDAALEASPDLKAAEAALRAARETVAARRGSFWPTIDTNVGSNRHKELDATPYTLHTAQLSIGYMPDVFGANWRQVEALSAEVNVQRFEGEAVYMTLVANVVNAVIEEASLRAQIVATKEMIALSSRLLNLAQRQHRAGEVGGADVAVQEAALAQAQAVLPSLEKQLVEQRNRLAVLCGRLPSDQPEQHFELDALSLPLELPISVPSRLVEQRPDIRAAEAHLHAASAQIGVAMAARLPSFTLAANLGSSSSKVSQLLHSGGGFWSLGADLLQPLFNGGTLRHQQRAAEATYDQAAAQYRSTVLAAFQNTADTLQAIVSDAETLRAASTTEAAARRSLGMAQRQRELGSATQAELILAQQTYQGAVLALVQAQASRYTNTVALYQALGGWWQAPSVRVGQASSD